MDLLALAAFQQIVEHRGISGASRAVLAPKTTLSRRLRQLETELGTRLIERGPRIFALTDEGTALFERTRTLLAELEEVGQSLSGGLSQPRGRLRVSAPIQFIDHHLAELLPGFVATYPAIDLEVVGNDRIVDPLLEGFDVVVRVNPSVSESMIGRLLYREHSVLVGVANPPDHHEADETEIDVIALPFPASDKVWTIETGGERRAFMPRPILRLTSIRAARAAVLAGVGVAVLPSSAVAADLARGSLHLWGWLPSRPIELWALYRSRQVRGTKVTAFVDYLHAGLADLRAGLDA